MEGLTLLLSGVLAHSRVHNLRGLKELRKSLYGAVSNSEGVFDGVAKSIIEASSQVHLGPLGERTLLVEFGLIFGHAHLPLFEFFKRLTCCLGQVEGDESAGELFFKLPPGTSIRVLAIPQIFQHGQSPHLRFSTY